MSKLRYLITAHWKALMPLVAFVASQLANQVFDLSTPAGWKALGLAAVSAVMVYAKRNIATPPLLPATDAGSISVGVLLRVGAAVYLAVFTLVGFDWVTAEHALGWLGAGLTLWLLAGFAEGTP